MKVLIVDDREDNRCMLDTLLRGNGHETILATNGIEAIGHARKGCDLVVSDVLMPQMDGFELCRTMKADSDLQNIPIIFYTATYTDAKDAEFGLSIGAERYLIKPSEPEELLRTFAEVVAAPARHCVTQLAPDEDPVYLREYNSRLISKLEQKSLELNATNLALTAELAAREKIESQLRQSQKLDALGRLAAGIAHDFNNILAGILGHIELARLDALAGVPVQPHFDAIGSAANRAHDLVQQILTFSRQKERIRKPLHLHSALDDALKLLRATIPQSIEIRSSFDISAPCVLADLIEIHQIATNLVTNAWHAIGDGPGVIEIRTECARADAGLCEVTSDITPGEYVRLSVKDTGSGIEPDVIEHIFDPFFTTKAPGKGSGLGLAVVHGIVKACGGATVVRSEPGRGATIECYFPAVAGAVASHQKAGDSSGLRMGNRQRILFIDDETTLTMLGARFLSVLDYRAETMTDPIAAVARFREEAFDLVVTDFSMPSANGLQVARECHAIRPEVPIIITSGYNPNLDAHSLPKDGVVAVLSKPYTIRTLGEAIASALL